jgi:hypothetical protein
MARKHINARQRPKIAPSPKASQLLVGFDPITKLPAKIIFIKKGTSAKSYLCPYCNQKISPGEFHLVVVPQGQKDLRRHWHIPCYKRIS